MWSVAVGGSVAVNSHVHMYSCLLQVYSTLYVCMFVSCVYYTLYGCVYCVCI